MCEITDGFKLCTCGETITQGMDYWQLKRLGIANNFFDLEMGRCMNLSYDMAGHLLADKILHSLNHANPFDFDYTPMQHDILNLTFYQNGNSIKFEFYFDNNQWYQEMTLSEHLDKKMIAFQGLIRR